MLAEEQERIKVALDFAHRCHLPTFRKDRLPYLTHPLVVLKRLRKWQVFDIEMWLAAICHDILEDCPVTSEQLKNVIGITATTYVEELTFRGRGKNERSEDYQRAKSEHLGEFKNKSLGALVIKMADRIENTRDFLQEDPAYAKTYLKRADGLLAAFELRQFESSGRFPVQTMGLVLLDLLDLQKEIENHDE